MTIQFSTYMSDIHASMYIKKKKKLFLYKELI